VKTAPIRAGTAAAPLDDCGKARRFMVSSFRVSRPELDYWLPAPVPVA
jgi:hypothetical protein